MITLLTGENTYAISQAVAERIAEFEGDAERYEGTELVSNQLPDLFTGATLFASNRLVVIRDSASNKLLWSDLEQWIERVPAESNIVLIENSPDKRTRTYKQLQKHGTVKEHRLLQDSELVSWVQNRARDLGADLSSDVAKYLVSYVGHDQWRLASELDKLMLSEKPLTRELIQDIAEPYPEASAFELLDSIFSGNDTRARTLISQLRQREDPYQFFGLLSSQVMALLAITSAGTRSTDEIAKDVGLHPFVVRKLSGPARRLGKKGASSLAEKLAECDYRMKTSSIDPWQQLELTILTSLAT